MKVVTWNVNSIQSRLKRVLDFLNREEPDLLCLQEIKCLEEKFPFSEFEALGYHCSVSGQKAYNGVALISRSKLFDISKGMNQMEFDQEARLIAAKTDSLYVINLYVPNGQEIGSDKYQFKLNWLQAFESHLRRILLQEKNILLCGDFNIAPSDLDVYDPKALSDSLLVSPAERVCLKKILSLGFSDIFRVFHADQKTFSWWDYRRGAFSQNQGLRIDLFLATESLIGKIETTYIDTQERKGEQPSDHAPVVCVFKSLA